MAWFELGRLATGFKLGKGRDLWGTLHGTEVLRDPKEASVLRRDVLIEWDSYGNMRINDI